jgi:pentalenolactone synthase
MAQKSAGKGGGGGRMKPETSTRDSEIEWSKIPAGRPGWRVTGHAQVKELLEDRRLDLNPDPSTTAQWYQDSPLHRVIVRLASMPIRDGGTDFAERALRRTALTGMFAQHNIQEVTPRVWAAAEELLVEMAAKTPPVDLCEEYSIPLCVRIVCEMLKVPVADMAKFREWSGDHEETDMRRSLLGLKRLMTYVNDLIRKRTEDPGDDVVSMLLSAHADIDNAHAGLIPNIVAFLIGLGWQGPASAIDSGVLLFAANPEQLRLFRDEPATRSGAVEEILRLFDFSSAAIGGLDRYANADFEFGGVKVRAGDMVLLDIPTANRDGRVFADPDRFDIRRTPNPHLTFGHGFYYCNFNKVARLETEVGLTALYQRFPTLRPVEERAQLQYRERPRSGPVKLLVDW